MANKKILLGMLVIALVFGMTVVGCDEPEDDNPYKGNWSGTFKPRNEDEVEATIAFTDTTWTLTAETTPRTTITGTYTIGALQAATLSKDGYSIASGIVILNSLTITFNNGDLGSFTRDRDTPQNDPLSDPFIGTWNSTNFKSLTGNPESATVVFTATTWTLTVGAATQSGTYTKSSIGYTATLTYDNYTAGSGIVNPVTKTLTLTITNGTHTGKSGSFTRPQ